MASSSWRSCAALCGSPSRTTLFVVSIDFIEGVATALTPIAFFETVMVRSYENLVDSDTRVDVNTGIVAAGRQQSLIDSRDNSHDLLVMKVQMDQICDAVKSTLPQEMCGEIIEKLEELEEHPEALDVRPVRSLAFAGCVEPLITSPRRFGQAAESRRPTSSMILFLRRKAVRNRAIRPLRPTSPIQPPMGITSQ
ncbi:MAG: hypothetical protein QOG79_8038 [Mycobacterium sp.]|jgi:hypothetical protein|nr:hypothetical protein [Mycobacterium sp.]MDT5317746.1 hypothetical protein [Mycobacterium sp.]